MTIKKLTFEDYFAENPDAAILLTDSYKFGHWAMYREGTQNISSYFESRNGAKYSSTVFFGLQYILKKHLVGAVITQEMVDAAEEFTNSHFMGNTKFNRAMWQRIVDVHGGKLPIRIKAVPEGSRIPVSNILMDVEVTDEELGEDGKSTLMAALTNYFEGLLTHVWATCNVATISRHLRDVFEDAFELSVEKENHWMIDYMLHDFGFRGVTGVDQAGRLGSAHLVSFKGTDTPVAITYPMKYYNTREMLGYSVNATEHSIMCQLGAENDIKILKEMLPKYPNGVFSCVGDSKSIVEFVEAMGTDPELRELILNRNGKFVVRPDSPRFEGDNPEDQIMWIINKLSEYFGHTENSLGFKEHNPKVGLIYGDGLSADQINNSVKAILEGFWAASTCIFGMGGGLLQKHNRDTQRFAFKCSSRKQDNEWNDVYKKPLDASKASKAGRLKLIKKDGQYMTVREEEYAKYPNELVTVFENGELVYDQDFQTIRETALNSRN